MEDAVKVDSTYNVLTILLLFRIIDDTYYVRLRFRSFYIWSSQMEISLYTIPPPITPAYASLRAPLYNVLIKHHQPYQWD